MNSSKGDRCFDDIATKFHNNIYGSTKGRLRHQLLFDYLSSEVELTAKPLRVLDAGGGTGMMTESLLAMGHDVTLTDISGESLAFAKHRLSEYSSLTVMHTDILSLPRDEPYDLVICHAVLEWLEQPYPVIEKLMSLLKPKGHISLSFFNYDAQLFGNMCYGNFDYVEKGMQTKNRVRLTPNYPLKPKDVISALECYPVRVQHMAGIRCFHDYMRDLDKQTSQYDALLALERQYGKTDPFMWLGKYFHVICSNNVR